MRQGNHPAVLLDEAGHLIAFGTGSDACAEHECGMRPMLEALTDSVEQDADIVAALRRGEKVVYPSLLEQRRIRHPERLQFTERPAQGQRPAEAMLGYARVQLAECLNELDFPHPALSRGRDINLAGAWGEKAFAFRVRGDALVAALREFYQDLRNGHGVFAGLFLKSPGMGGVIVANARRLSAGHRESIARAQTKHESQLRLRARDDVEQLRAEMRAAVPAHKHARHLGYLWAVWADAQESELVYALNPGCDVSAQYYGPYTRQQLLDWAASGYAYALQREQRTPA